MVINLRVLNRSQQHAHKSTAALLLFSGFGVSTAQLLPLVVGSGLRSVIFRGLCGSRLAICLLRMLFDRLRFLEGSRVGRFGLFYSWLGYSIVFHYRPHIVLAGIIIVDVLIERHLGAFNLGVHCVDA